MDAFKDHLSELIGLRLVQNRASGESWKKTDARCLLNGTDGNQSPLQLPMNDELFSKHLLFLGNIGTGKTNAISQIVAQIKQSMTDDDIMIVFDTKGDFYTDFYEEGLDLVISNQTSRFTGQPRYWNIFADIIIDGTPRSIKENAPEVANNLFTEKVKHTNQPFFPQAAKDIFATFLAICAGDFEHKENNNNQTLVEYLENITRQELLDFFGENGFGRIQSYLSPDAAAQADGVMSELHQMLSEIFVGDFREWGDLSMRQLIREKGARTVFVEYDISVGSVLAPIYRLLFDLAIKESISKNRSKGNVWFVIDEFSLIPHLQHIDSGINFGRSQGIKFIIGAQNIPQIYKAYGEYTAESLLSGLSTVFSFRIDDKRSRDFIQNRYGLALQKLAYRKTGQTAQGQIAEEIRQAKVVEDWQISRLKQGEAIVGLSSEDPFIFRFGRFDPGQGKTDKK